jgi:ferrous iron transport protein B
MQLGVPVVETVATRGTGVEALRKAIERAVEMPLPERRFELPPTIAKELEPVESKLLVAGFHPHVAGMEALRLLSVPLRGYLSGVEGLHDAVESARTRLEKGGVSTSSLEAELRYAWIGDVVEEAVRRFGPAGTSLSDRVDAVVLHRVFGPLIFLATMAIVFQAIFTWAEPLIGGVEAVIGALGDVVAPLLPPGDLRSLVVDGVIAGVGSVVVFLPQIVILFLFIGILEATGYMARAAFIMDRFMRGVGLHGRSFIPMLSGYACAVPGIMAARTIENRQDRLATIMVVPLMSCSARLPVYTLLIGTFIPPTIVAGVFNLRGLTLLAMYLLGTVAALVVAGIFKKTLLKGPSLPMIMELPPYRVPNLRGLLLSVSHRAGMFLRRAGTIILALSILLWALASYPKLDPVAVAAPTAEAAQEQQLAGSLLGRAGHTVEPLVRPLGYDWKIGVSIISSLAAREVFVATMGTIYGVGSDVDETSSALRDRLRAERHADGSPVYTPLIALGLMVFYVFAMMCVSTNAVVVRETGGGWTGVRWAGFQFLWMLALAYAGAFLVYRGGLLLGFNG